MILVETSIWIVATRNKTGPEARELDSLIARDEAATTDLIMAEVLQGAANEREFAEYRDKMRGLHYLEAGHDVWMSAADLSFRLRRRGLTTALSDLVIASVALANDLEIYTVDSDFERVPNLKIYKPT